MTDLLFAVKCPEQQEELFMLNFEQMRALYSTLEVMNHLLDKPIYRIAEWKG